MIRAYSSGDILEPADPISEFCFSFAGAFRSRKEVYLGDENSLTLTFNAKNEGEGGAYEAELYVVLPPEADYSGIARDNEVRRNPGLFQAQVFLSAIGPR